MGNLLRALSRLEGAGDCCSNANAGGRGAKDLFVDFEDARPAGDGEDSTVYDRAEEVLERAAGVLEALKQYKGATKEIREAIGKPSAETEAAAWAALRPSVMKLQSFYEFSKELDVIVPDILVILCSPGDDAGSKISLVEQLDDHQALVKQLARLLDFVLKFDELKMTTPAVQNDFSYYRRTIQRNRNSVPRSSSAAVLALQDIPLPIDLANQMSLFFAHATPLLNKMSEVTAGFVSSAADQRVAGNVTDVLSVMAKVCQKMLESPDLRSRLRSAERTEPFILRVMVATVILYDHVHPTGAFARGSSVDVKGCVRLLRDQDRGSSAGGQEDENLLNALRYTTRHLNDESTPRSIKALLFEDAKGS